MTTATTEPKIETGYYRGCNYHTRARVYFYRRGVELSDHPYNGAEITGTGAGICGRGRFTIRTELFIRIGNDKITVTADDFDGPVSVKEWSPLKSEISGLDWIKSGERMMNECEAGCSH